MTERRKVSASFPRLEEEEGVRFLLVYLQKGYLLS